MATEVRINLREEVTKGIDRIEQRLVAAARSTQNAGEVMDETFEQVSRSANNAARRIEGVNTAERRVSIGRQEFTRQAKIMANQELVLTNAKSRSAQATNKQTQAEQKLNQTRRQGRGGGGGGGDGDGPLGDSAKDFEEQARRIDRARRLIEIGLLELFFTLHSLSKPIEIVTNYLQRFLELNISAAAEVEKFASTLKVASGDIASANITLQRLLDITVDLIAIDTSSLIEFSSRLQTAGLNAKQAENAIVAITKRMEEQGKSASSTRRVLEQLVQAVNANLITMQDFRPILREYPKLYSDFSAALGRTITDLDSFRDAADEVGGASRAIAIGLDYVSQVAQGAEINTVVRQIDELRDRIFVLRSELGHAIQPFTLFFLKTLNSVVERLQGTGEAFRVFIGAFAAGGVVIGRFTGLLIQLGIVAIVSAQIQGATLQITNMATAMNAATVAAGGAATQMAELPRHLQTATRVVNGVNKALPVMAGILGVVALLLPTITALWVKFTEQTRLARKELETHLSILNAIPEAIHAGDAALGQQIRSLQNYRKELVASRQELVKLNQARRDAARQTDAGGFDSILGVGDVDSNENRNFLGGQQSQRLQDLNRRIGETRTEIRDLNKIVNNSSDRFGALSRVLERTKQRLIDAVEAGNSEEYEKQRKNVDLLVATYRRWNKEVGELNGSLINLSQEVIKIDFLIRRLERTFKGIGQSDVTTRTGLFDPSALTESYNALDAALVREADLRKRLAKETEDDASKLADDILKIEEQLSFDRENIKRDYNKRLSNLEYDVLKSTRDAQRLIIEANEDAEQDRYERARYWAKRHAELEYERFTASRDAQRLINKANADALLQRDDTDRYWAKRHAELEYERFTASRDAQRLINKANADALLQRDATERYWAKRHAEIEYERFTASRDAQRLITEHSRAATEARDNAQRNRERLAEIDKLANAIQQRSNEIISSNNRIIRQFSRGVSRSLTDLLYDGEATFAEFLTEFAKSSTQIIIQTRIEAEIRKRISDDLTRHQIVNIQKVAAAQVAAGNTASTLSAAQVSGFSPVASFASGGIGTIALIGLTIAPFLVRAIRDGFEDTTVELDKREIGKVTANSVRDLVREGRVRL